MRSASLGAPSECDGMALFHLGTTLRSAAAVTPRVPTRKSSWVAKSPRAASNTRSLKGAGKTLLGAEQDQRGSCRSGTANVLVPGDQGNSSRDRDRDGLCVAVDGGELRARLLGSGGRDAAHGVYHRVELPDAFDPSGDVREPLGHGLTAFSAAGASGTAALM